MAKKSGIKIPKRIAGVKIPRSIRKGPIGDFLSSSGGQVVLAEALLALGAIYAARRIDPNSPTGELLQHPIDGVRSRLSGNGLGYGRLATAGERLGRAFHAGVQAFRDELHGVGEGASVSESALDADAPSSEAVVESEVTVKKPSSPRDASRRASTSSPH
jgi:hypothetical protein